MKYFDKEILNFQWHYFSSLYHFLQTLVEDALSVQRKIKFVIRNQHSNNKAKYKKSKLGVQVSEDLQNNNLQLLVVKDGFNILNRHRFNIQ